MLFNSTDTDLAHTSNGGDVTDLGGDDITFRGLDATTCGGPASCTLAHEIEMYDNSTVTSLTENPAGVWDANYQAVWHLDEGGNGTFNEFADSTTNANHGQGGDGVASDTGPHRVKKDHSLVVGTLPRLTPLSFVTRQLSDGL